MSVKSKHYKLHKSRVYDSCCIGFNRFCITLVRLQSLAGGLQIEMKNGFYTVMSATVWCSESSFDLTQKGLQLNVFIID